jgi:hypothetical protein
VQQGRVGRPRAAAAPLELLLGEIRTGLVQNSSDLAGEVTSKILRLRVGGRVRTMTRPASHVMSPELSYGVHCPLATVSGSGVDGIGTVLARASITGGRVLQASTRTLLTRADADYRLPWSHYVARLGVVEVSGKADADDLADGFLQSRSRDTLDLGAVSGRVLDTVQRSRELDRSAPFVARRTQLRFAVHLVGNDPSSCIDGPEGEPGRGHDEGGAEAGSRVELMIDDDVRRTLRIRIKSRSLVEVVDLCEDLALHDWLLTTVLDAVEGWGVPVADDEWIFRLRPMIDHILHLWMPGRRVADELLTVWDGLERRPGFSRQWEGLVARIRDQMTLSMIKMMSARSEGRPVK